MAPKSVAQGLREAGIGQRRGCQTAPSEHGAPTARYGVASSSGRHCSALRGLARFYATWMDGALRAACLVRLLAKGISHSRRRLSHIPSRKAAGAPAEICSALPLASAHSLIRAMPAIS